MNRLLSTLMLPALAGAVILSTGCGATASPAGGGKTIAAVTAAARDLDPTAEHQSDDDRVSYFESIFDRLRALPQLAPLFERYAVPDPTGYEDDDDVEGLEALLRDLKLRIRSGILTIVNRETGGVVFSAPLRDLASGVLHPENLPGGAGAPGTPAPTCTAFTYSAWGACSNGTQARTVTSSSPGGCAGGAPVLSQSCSATAPTCTAFTYSAWGACQANGTQTRAVTSSSPAGCAGGSPLTSQPCTFSAPNPVTAANVVSSCAGCHGLTSNGTVFRSGGYTVRGRSASQWLSTVNGMVSRGATLAPGTTAQNYADYLANVP